MKAVPVAFIMRVSLLSGLGISLLSAQSGGKQLPDGQGKATVQRVCAGCHAPEIVLGKHETKDRWVQIVTDMVNKGANGTDDEFNEIIDYLAAHFPPATPSNQ